MWIPQLSILLMSLILSAFFDPVVIREKIKIAPGQSVYGNFANGFQEQPQDAFYPGFQDSTNFQGPPPGFQPPPGYQGPPQGYQGPPQGFQGPPQGYQAPPPNYQGPPPTENVEGTEFQPNQPQEGEFYNLPSVYVPPPQGQFTPAGHVTDNEITTGVANELKRSVKTNPQNPNMKLSLTDNRRKTVYSDSHFNLLAYVKREELVAPVEQGDEEEEGN